MLDHYHKDFKLAAETFADYIDFPRQAYGGGVSISTPTMLSGNMFTAGNNANGVATAANQLYDPVLAMLVAPKTPFPGNIIPASASIQSSHSKSSLISWLRINPTLARQSRQARADTGIS